MAEHHDLELERTLEAPVDLVWRAWTEPEHLRRWWAPKPYETPECELDLRPGGIFYTRMTGPDGFDSENSGCFLEIVPGAKIVWTTLLEAGYRPNPLAAEACGGLAFTAIMTFEDAGGGRTLYRAVAMHRSDADRDRHAELGFHEGWGTVSEQLGDVTRSLGETV